MSDRFNLVVYDADVSDILRFAQGLVMRSECSSFSLAVLLMEAAELAIVNSEADWKFKESSQVSFDNLRVMTKARAFQVYNNGNDDYFCS